MLRNDQWFWAGWLYFLLMFVLELVLPTWMGDENGVIESLQLLCLAGGSLYCWRMRRKKQEPCGGRPALLWSAGVICFFLLFMREISWGRVFFMTPGGEMIQYSQMGLYGKLVHPLVGGLTFAILLLLYHAKFWRVLLTVKLPLKSFGLLLLFVFMAWLGEHVNFTGFHGQVAEELAELGAYMMLVHLARDVGQELQQGRMQH